MLNQNANINPSVYQNIGIVKDAFGINGRVAIYSLGDSKPGENKDTYFTSGIGTPVWDRIKLRNVKGDNLNFWNEKGNVVSMPSYTFPDTIILGANSQSKDFIETKFAGGKGSTIEEISLNNWEITIRGLIINYENDDYPRKEVRQLMGIFRRPFSCGVESKYLNDILHVYNLFFSEASLNLIEGYGNVQPFELTCMSDEPIEFQLIKL